MSHFQDWVPVQSKLAKQLFDGVAGTWASIIFFDYPVPKACRYFVVTDSNNHHPILKVGGGMEGIGGVCRFHSPVNWPHLFVDRAACSESKKTVRLWIWKPGCRLDYDAIFNPSFSLARYCSSLASEHYTILDKEISLNSIAVMTMWVLVTL